MCLRTYKNQFIIRENKYLLDFKHGAWKWPLKMEFSDGLKFANFRGKFLY